MTFLSNTPQHKKEAIDNGARSKLNPHLVLRIACIYEMLAYEVIQWLNQNALCPSTNAENVAAQNGGGGWHSKTPPSKAMMVNVINQWGVRR